MRRDCAFNDGRGFLGLKEIWKTLLLPLMTPRFSSFALLTRRPIYKVNFVQCKYS